MSSFLLDVALATYLFWEAHLKHHVGVWWSISLWSVLIFFFSANTLFNRVNALERSISYHNASEGWQLARLAIVIVQQVVRSVFWALLILEGWHLFLEPVLAAVWAKA